MAFPRNIEDLIKCRVIESDRVEFTSDWDPTPIIHSICAFANDIDNVGGGYIVIGVEEKNGSPVIPIKGIEQERIDGILKELIGLCHFIEPLYNPIVEPVMFQGKYVIVIVLVSNVVKRNIMKRRKVREEHMAAFTFL